MHIGATTRNVFGDELSQPWIILYSFRGSDNVLSIMESHQFFSYRLQIISKWPFWDGRLRPLYPHDMSPKRTQLKNVSSRAP